MTRIQCKLCDNTILLTTAEITGGLCMPCKKPKTKIEIDPDDPVGLFRQAKLAAFNLMSRLEDGEALIEDSEVMETYFALEKRMQSNCDSVAQGLLVVMASLCSKKRHLTEKLFPSALAPVYALGFESYDDLSSYLSCLASNDEPYLGTPTRSGQAYLMELSSSKKLVRDAINTVWLSMRRTPPEEDEYIPEILKPDQSEQIAAGQSATAE